MNDLHNQRNRMNSRKKNLKMTMENNKFDNVLFEECCDRKDFVFGILANPNVWHFGKFRNRCIQKQVG